jgi:hypothetical protein
MLVEDTAAFIEQLEVLEADRRAQKRRSRLTRAELEVMHDEVEARLASEALQRLATDLAIARELGDTGGARRLGRELAMLRGHSRAALRKLSSSRSRLERLQCDLPADDGGRRARMFRLHSTQHHFECSEARFVRLARSQARRPVLVATHDGRHWWWYLDRFWWDDEGLSTRDVAAVVLRSDVEREQRAAELARARADVLGDEPVLLTREESVSPIVRFAVWCRDRGRCVDCGAADDVEYEQIIPFSKGGLRWIANVELRCAPCSRRRLLNTVRSDVSRARIESTAYQRYPST